MKEFAIIYENAEIYIINKPAGVSVQGGAGVKHPLDEIFAKQVGAKVFPVHRLDKETCGLLVVAKTHEAARKWTNIFATHQVKKEYIAICAGKLPQKSGKITDTILEHGQKKAAVTNYVVEQTKYISFLPNELNANAKLNENVANYDENSSKNVKSLDNDICISQARLVIETGRMHQIRIHLARSGCPIIGDDKHGNFRLNKMFRKVHGIKNMMLAAVSLSLPIGNAQKTFAIEPPEYFKLFDIL